MEVIGSLDFNYWLGCRILRIRRSDASAESTSTMKKSIILAVPVALVAIAALVLSFRSPVPAETVIGYVGVLMLLGIASLEYRISWRRLFGRT